MALRYLIAVLRLRLRLFAGVAAVIGAAGLGAALILPDVYASAAVLHVTTDDIADPLAPARRPGEEEMQVLRARLMTRAVLLDLATHHDIKPDATDDQRIAALRARTEVSLSTGRNQAALMTLRFRAADPAQAHAVMQDYLTHLDHDGATRHGQDATGPTATYRAELVRLGRALSDQTAAITRFRSDHDGLLPDALPVVRADLARQKSALDQIARDRAELRDKRAQIVGQYDNGLRPGQGTSAAERNHARIAQALGAARAVYADHAPKVIALRNELAEARKLLDAERSADPMRAMFKVQIAAIDDRLTALRTKEDAVRSDLDQTQAKLRQIPLNDLQLDALKRDFQTVEAQYTRVFDALTRLETQQATRGQGGWQVSVVDPPFLPTDPIAPNRRAIVLGAALVGLLAGAGAVIVAERSTQLVRRPQDLVRHLGITPIVTIPQISTRPKPRLTADPHQERA